jgi:regulator of sigma E protease
MQTPSELARLAEALGGLPILGCLAGSPAAEAGIRYGDVLLTIDGVPMQSWDDFLRVRRDTKGSFLARIFRAGLELEIRVDLRPSNRTPLDILSELIGEDEIAEALVTEAAN